MVFKNVSPITYMCKVVEQSSTYKSGIKWLLDANDI